MNMHILIAAVLIVGSLFTSCNSAGGKTPRKQVNIGLNQGTSTEDLGVTKETAVRSALEDAKKTYGLTDEVIVFPCDQMEFWRILFEPRTDASNNAGPEYLIDKRTGLIVSKRKIPLGAGNNSELSPKPGKIDREKAITIASKDAVSAYGSKAAFDLTLCELTNVWRVIYSPRKGLNGGGPEYVIDKTTGKILDKKYYQ